MMLGSRLRTVVGTGLVVAAALFMTACGPEEDSAANASPTASASQGADEGAGESGGAAAASGGSSDGGTTTGGSADGGSADGGGSSDGGSANGGADDASSDGGTGGGDDGAGAKTASGELTYLAPGKYLVGDQAFWVAEDTEVWGAGGLCGDGEGQVAAECTADQLEDAAKRGGTEVTVEMTDGVATTVREGSDG